MARGRLILAATAGLVLIASAPAFAQTPLGDPLDDHSAKRLDRMEKVVRELRAIVFQGRETGQPGQKLAANYLVKQLSSLVGWNFEHHFEIIRLFLL